MHYLKNRDLPNVELAGMFCHGHLVLLGSMAWRMVTWGYAVVETRKGVCRFSSETKRTLERKNSFGPKCFYRGNLLTERPTLLISKLSQGDFWVLFRIKLSCSES